MSTPSIRHSPLAGTWYPGTSGVLRRTIEEFLAAVPDQPLQGELYALVAPHAGYQFSGQTAAHSYKHVIGKKFDAVIVVGPSHFAWVGDFAISAESAYETPLGLVPLADELIAELGQQLPVRRVRGDREHSVEIQLPFLQYALGEFPFVPILMSADELTACARLGQALAERMRERNILLVASTDLNHMDSYSAVKRYDAEVIAAIERFDLEAMADVLLDPAHTVCGRAPVLAVSAAAQALGANRVQLLNHTNSGDVTGRRAEGIYTVGYLSAALIN